MQPGGPCFLHTRKRLGNTSRVTWCEKLKEDRINWNRKFLPAFFSWAQFHFREKEIENLKV